MVVSCPAVCTSHSLVGGRAGVPVLVVPVEQFYQTVLGAAALK